MSRERGLALVSVLWGVAILSLIAAAMLSASLTTAQIGHNDWNAARAGAVADAGVNQAILSLMDERAARQPRADGTSSSLAFDGVPVRLWIQDESGRINLNYAPKELLQSLFASAGLSAGDAGALADRIVARRGTDLARTLVTFRGVEDVLAVPGMTRALFDRVAPALTVFGPGTTVNMQVAPREALRALPNMDEDAISRLLEQRRTIAKAGGALAIAQSDFQITAEVTAGGAHVVRMAVVQFTGDPAKPYLILAWR